MEAADIIVVVAVVEYKMPPDFLVLLLLRQHYKETQGEIGCHRKVLVVGPGDVAVVEAEDDDDDVVVVVAVVDGGVGRGRWRPTTWEWRPTEPAVEAEYAQLMPPIRPRREVVVEDSNPLDLQNRNPIELMMLSPLPFVVMNWSDCPVID